MNPPARNNSKSIALQIVVTIAIVIGAWFFWWHDQPQRLLEFGPSEGLALAAIHNGFLYRLGYHDAETSSGPTVFMRRIDGGRRLEIASEQDRARFSESL